MPATGQEPGCTRARVHHPVVAFQECIQKRIEEGQYKAKYKMIVEEEVIICQVELDLASSLAPSLAPSIASSL